jgi:hypothetical protein
MLCDFRDGACVRCGVRRQPPYPKRNCNPGLGDRIASGLSAVGITKARVAAAARRVGINDCGCNQRQQLANELGYRLGIGEKPALQQDADRAEPKHGEAE